MHIWVHHTVPIVTVLMIPVLIMTHLGNVTHSSLTHVTLSLLHMSSTHLILHIANHIISRFTIVRHISSLRELIPIGLLINAIKHPFVVDIFFITEFVEVEFHFSSDD